MSGLQSPEKQSTRITARPPRKISSILPLVTRYSLYGALTNKTISQHLKRSQTPHSKAARPSSPEYHFDWYLDVRRAHGSSQSALSAAAAGGGQTHCVFFHGSLYFWEPKNFSPSLVPKESSKMLHLQTLHFLPASLEVPCWDMMVCLPWAPYSVYNYRVLKSQKNSIIYYSIKDWLWQ